MLLQATESAQHVLNVHPCEEELRLRNRDFRSPIRLPALQPRTPMFNLVRSGILTAALLFLLLLVGLAKLATDYVKAVSWVDHTNQVIEETNAARGSLARAQGRISTRRTKTAIGELERRVQKLHALTVDNIVQQGNLENLQAALERLASNPADRIAAFDVGTALEQMRDEEYRLLIARSQVNNTALHRVGLILLILWTLTCTVGMTTGIAAWRQSRKRRDAETALRIEKEEFAHLAQQLAVVSAGSKCIQAAQSEGQVEQAIGQILQDLVPGSSGSFALVNHDTGELVTRAQWGAALAGPGIRSSECEALKTMRAVIGREAYVVCAACAAHPGSREHVCIPIRSGTEELGLIHIQMETAIDRRQIHTVTIFAAHVALGLTNLRMRETLRQQSVRDDLTRLFNRRFFDETLKREFLTSIRTSKPLSILLIDVDHFKRFNDTYGHHAGDQVLFAVSKILSSGFRGNDVVARYGGEEFAVILLAADLRSAYEKAELLRRTVEGSTVDTGTGIVEQLTISIGAAQFSPEQTPEELIRSADAALYAAKRSGRNRTVCSKSMLESAGQSS